MAGKEEMTLFKMKGRDNDGRFIKERNIEK